MMMNHMYCIDGVRLQHRIISLMESASDCFKDEQECLDEGNHVASEVYHRTAILEQDKIWGLMEIMGFNADEEDDEFDMVSEYIIDAIQNMK